MKAIIVVIFALISGPLLAAEQIKVPFKLGLGKTLYDEHCASCHGSDGFGVDKKGPPLMHKYYEPSHHSDQSFYRAVQQGVKQHHWNFGDMEPVPAVSQRATGNIIKYVRWLQQQHGIH